MAELTLTRHSGTYFRMVYDSAVPDALNPTGTPEGRFHRSGQTALYMSPRPAWAEKALQVYIRPDDPPRSFVTLDVANAGIVDLRQRATRDSFGIREHDVRADWRSERKTGLPASSWAVSDTLRDMGADGMLYTSRTEDHRWNLVLFHWNTPDAPTVTLS